MSGHQDFRVPSRRQLRRLGLRYAGIAGSLAFHAVILVLALATYTVGKQLIGEHREVTIVPDETIIDGAKAGGVPNPGIGGDRIQPPAMLDAPPAPSDISRKRESKALEPAVMGEAPDAGQGVIGIGAHALLGQEVEAEAPFGVPGGGERTAPRSTFMGSSGDAMRVVYVCDCSGSMTDRMPVLLNELERSVKNLVPIQGFNVIFFSSGKPQMLASGLVSANSLNKEKLKAFLTNIDIRKSSDPRPSLQTAFSESPDLIYLLTDGDFNTDEYGEGARSDAQVVRLIRWLNRDHQVHVNTIAFSSADPGSAGAQSEFVRTLKTIAGESGGTFRFVSSGR
jgi:hypothetical protein